MSKIHSFDKFENRITTLLSSTFLHPAWLLFILKGFEEDLANTLDSLRRYNAQYQSRINGLEFRMTYAEFMSFMPWWKRLFKRPDPSYVVEIKNLKERLKRFKKLRDEVDQSIEHCVGLADVLRILVFNVDHFVLDNSTKIDHSPEDLRKCLLMVSVSVNTPKNGYFYCDDIQQVLTNKYRHKEKPFKKISDSIISELQNLELYLAFINNDLKSHGFKI